MKKYMGLVLCASILLLMAGCTSDNGRTKNDEAVLRGVDTPMPTEEGVSIEVPTVAEVLLPTETVISTEGSLMTGEPTLAEVSQEPEMLHFVDVFGAPYEVEINPQVERQTYLHECFVHDGDCLSYVGDERYRSRLGIDVSSFQGDVDWDAVKDAGIEFVIIRLGYRGYGQAGTLCLDKKFLQNIEGAQAQGLDVGVYFFAQAVNEAEAVEEAEFVLRYLEGYELQLPVVYDPESILDDTARTDDVTGEQFTLNTLAFCERIKEAGYEAMVYSNMLWEAYKLDLAQLSDYPIWYADYELLPQTPYRFSFWQYTNTGRVAGIIGDVDYNIQLIPTE